MNIVEKIKTTDKKILLVAAIVILVIILVIGALVGPLLGPKDSYPAGDIEKSKSVAFDLGENLVVTHVGSYSGQFVEDGSDEEVTDVMMIQVKNQGPSTMQYAEVTTSGKGGEAHFKLSTLQPGQTVTVLETDRQKYKKNKCETATAKNMVFFQEEQGVYAGKLEIQPLDGGLNVTNISGKDIKGEIIIYFKDTADGMLMGGITYRGRITGGLAAGEIRQLMSENFTQDNTQIMFITINGK